MHQLSQRPALQSTLRDELMKLMPPLKLFPSQEALTSTVGTTKPLNFSIHKPIRNTTYRHPQFPVVLIPGQTHRLQFLFSVSSESSLPRPKASHAPRPKKADQRKAYVYLHYVRFSALSFPLQRALTETEFVSAD
jgi:hypothetical protein